MSRLHWAAAVLAGALAAGVSCSPQNEIVKPNVPDDPWSRGVFLYGQHCAGCHGEDGEGTEGRPKLAPLARAPQPGSDRKVTFETAADLQSYIKKTMPQLEPGTLTDAQAWDLTLYVLRQADVTVPKDFGPDTAATLKIP
jgi:mono/diheme cytochrome c family protein